LGMVVGRAVVGSDEFDVLVFFFFLRFLGFGFGFGLGLPTFLC